MHDKEGRERKTWRASVRRYIKTSRKGNSGKIGAGE